MPVTELRKSRRDDKSLPALVSELWQMVVAYAKQETIGPLKGLGRYVKFGVSGALCLMVGIPTVSLAGLRALQNETAGALNGHLSFVPYVIVGVAQLALVAFLASRIGKRRSS